MKNNSSIILVNLGSRDANREHLFVHFTQLSNEGTTHKCELAQKREKRGWPKDFH